MSQAEVSLNTSLPLSPAKSSYVDDLEASAQQQLKKVFRILSQSFTREVASVSDVSAVIKAFINKYNKNKEQLKALVEENENLNTQLQESIDQSQMEGVENEQLAQNEEELKKKLRQYKRRVLQLQQELQDAKTANEEARTQLRELTVQNEEVEREKGKLQTELSKTKFSMSQMEVPPVDKEPAEQTAQLFEDILASQANELNALVAQRNSLIEANNTLESALRAAESKLTQANANVEKLEADATENEGKLREMNEAIPILAQEVEQKIPHELRAKLPQPGNDHAKYILDVVAALGEMRVQNGPSDEEQAMQKEKDEKQQQKFMVLLAHLEDALKFIQNLSGSTEADANTVALGIDSQVRTVLLTQAARIGHYIDENLMELGVQNLPKGFNLFEADAFNGIETQLKEFLNFVTEEQLETSPVRELFALFTAVTEVNRMLMNYVEQKKEKAEKEVARGGPSNEAYKNLQRDNFDLAQWKAVNSERLENAQRALQAITGDDEAALDVMAKEVADKCQDALKANEELKHKVEELEEEMRLAKEENETTLQEVSTALQDREASFQEEAKTHEEEKQDLTKRVQDVTSQLEQLNTRYATTTEQLEQQLREKTQKLKKAVQSQNEQKRLLDAIQERTDRLIEENKELAGQAEEMQQTLAMQNEQIAAQGVIEKKLRDSREQLKKRLAASERQNSTVLENLKTRNEEIQQKYADAVGRLQEELEEIRAANEATAAEAEQARSEKAELTQQITALRVNERALKVKYNALVEKAGLEKSAAEARNATFQQSVKAQASRQIDEANSKLERAKESVTKILVGQFGEKVEEGSDMDELFTKLERRLQMFSADRRVLADAIKLRGELKLAPTQTLSDAFAGAEQAKASAEQNQARVQNERRALELELSNIKRATDKMAADAKQTQEWERWGRSLYKQVSEGPTTAASEEIRFQLGEAILLSIGDRQKIRQMEMLRQQKGITTSGAYMEAAAAGHTAELSFNSILSIVLFAKRVQTMACAVPPSMPLSPRKDIL